MTLRIRIRVHSSSLLAIANIEIGDLLTHGYGADRLDFELERTIDAVGEEYAKVRYFTVVKKSLLVLHVPAVCQQKVTEWHLRCRLHHMT